MPNPLFLASAILLMPFALFNSGLIVTFIREMRKANARFNPWLIVTTVAGVVVGVLALWW
ncbi:MAG: hypothetical protein GY832_20145 [Chloroflexi bacterium]|nr:hypothetical protein [Chloroflexota bacterium]